MEYLSAFFISFILIFFSELGDKTQLLVLSFSSKIKTLHVLVGVALGTFFSHGIAILFGSKLGLLDNNIFFKLITYIIFLFFGIIGFLPEKEKNSQNSFLGKLTNLSLNYIFIIALCIALGELGDKTLLASIGLGIDYPTYKISLILGSIGGMVGSNTIAIFFGKLIGNKISEKKIKFFSNLIFIIFGLFGLLGLIFNYYNLF